MSQIEESKLANTEQRLTLLEADMVSLLDALLRQGTNKDGNWGYQSCHDTINIMKLNLENRIKDQSIGK